MSGTTLQAVSKLMTDLLGDLLGGSVDTLVPERPRQRTGASASASTSSRRRGGSTDAHRGLTGSLASPCTDG